MAEDMEPGGPDTRGGGGEAEEDRGLQLLLLHSCRCAENQPGVLAWIDMVGKVGVAVVGCHKGLCRCEGCLLGVEVWLQRVCKDEVVGV